ncbi:MAG: putative zinc-binding protein [Candidatus Hydrogenedentes bacterium]|nr:putative zinc-binding protein [Candidatus Hydrogenedentota bacterium]
MVFACSGAADVGAIADQAARKLTREKTAAMCCTAAIAAEVPDIVAKADLATGMVVIDGCDKACAKSILEKSGFDKFAYVQLISLGMEKGKTAVTEENIAKAANASAEALVRDGACGA